MPRDRKSGFSEKLAVGLTWAAVLYLLVCGICWLLERKWGAILIVWLLSYFGSMIILGGWLTVITGDAGLVDEAWPWVLFGVAATVMTAIQWNLQKK